MTALGLCMIVKNEAHVIDRCLDSVRPLVDYVLVEDTGSSDDTCKVVQDWLERYSIEGKVTEEPWRDFGYNRTHAFETLRKCSGVDYALVMDADDVIGFNGSPEGIKRSLVADSYTIDVRDNGRISQRSQIFSSSKRFVYKGLIQEVLQCLELATSDRLDDVWVNVIGGGARSKDPDIYGKDMELFERGIADNRQDDLRGRYMFYMAEAARLAGEKEKAIELYMRRAQAGGNPEEVYLSLVTAARMREELTYPLQIVLQTYAQGNKVLPSRAEALYGAARLCRTCHLYGEGYELASRGIGLALPKGLLVDVAVYQWQLLYEFATCAFFIKRFSEALLAGELALRTGQMDSESANIASRVVAAARAECSRTN